MAKSPSANLKCGKCIKTFSVPENCLDRPVNCPYCYELLTINQQGSDNTPPIPPAPIRQDYFQPSAATTPPKALNGADIEFYCYNCSAPIQIVYDDYARMAGGTYECPSCRNPATVPVTCAKCGELMDASTTRCNHCGSPLQREPLKLADSRKLTLMQNKQTDPSDFGPASRPRNGWLFVATPVAALLILLIIRGLNFALVDQPVKSMLSADPRNKGYSLSARYGHYVNPSVLVLDLREVDSAAPVDLFRALFQSAEALHKAGRRFDKVVLARAGTPVFLMDGEEYSSIGSEFSRGQNPVYMIRTLPEKLFQPSGQAAFGQWEGGLLGVLGKQMEDANEAAQLWVSGR